MSPRLFTRSPKKTQEEIPEFEFGAGGEPLSINPSPAQSSGRDVEPETTTVSQLPRVSPPDQISRPDQISLPDQKKPGWYADKVDSGLMRYWDGFHFTGQAKRISAPASSVGEVDATTEPTPVPADLPSIRSEPEATNLDAPTRSQPPADTGEPMTVVEPNQNDGTPPGFAPPPSSGPYVPPAAGETSWHPGEPSSPAFPPSVVSNVASESGDVMTVQPRSDSSFGQDTSHQDTSDQDASGQHTSDGANSWGKDAERAVANALTVDTPQAWQEAAQVAAVVSQMSQTMQAVADAKQTAGEAAKAAGEAAETARVAAQTAAEAKKAAERMAKEAEESAKAAQVAAQKAVEAKDAAERTAKAAPKVAETAEIASQTAAEAKRKVEALDQVVAKARSANTPAAWSEALELAALAVKPKRLGSEAGTDRDTEDTATPSAHWENEKPVVGPGAGPFDQAPRPSEPGEAKDRSSQSIDDLAGSVWKPRLPQS